MPTQQAQQEPQTARTLRVLLVEDSENDAELVRIRLEAATSVRFEVEHAWCLEDAISRLATRPDVVLLDLSLPDAAGTDGVRRLSAVARDVPVVVMTGNEDEELAVRVVREGVHGYLGKNNATTALLVLTVRQALERHRTQCALEQAHADARLLATTDPLTGVANRMLLEERLERLVVDTRRSGRRSGVLVLDLDGFKRLNDLHGHSMGDAVLRVVAERLGTVVRESDTVARLGGDEFVVLLTNLGDEEDAGRVARKIVETLHEPIRLDGRLVRLSSSVGIATHPTDGDDPDALLQAADAAMYRAKRDGGDGYCFFRPEMTANASRRLAMEERLHEAPRNGELTLHFQPIVDSGLGAIRGAEALVRWNSPELGRLTPGDFIPVAEETGQILALGEWILTAACRQAADWLARGWRLDLYVNVSAHQLCAPDVVEVVERALSESGLPPECLVVEITETSLLDLSVETERSIRALDARGVRLVLDDFGMGYSCLAVLKRVPVHALKVDRHFVSGVVDQFADANVVATIVALARGFGARTVAEGIETTEQLEAIQELGCDHFQGFLFSPALPPGDFEALLARQREALRELAGKRD